MRVPWLSTTLAYDCGPACLAMVISYHGRETSVDEVRERLGTSRNGTTGLDILRVARSLGMEGKGVRVTEPAALGEVPLPAIAHYTRGHFVVVERYKPGRGVRVVDPLQGRLDLALPAFLSEFSGVAVLLHPGAAFRRARDKAWWKFLREALRGNLPVFLRLATLSFLLQVFAFALPAALAFVVDKVIPSLSLVLAGVPVLLFSYALSSWVRGAGMAALQWRVTRGWLDRVFRHLLRLPLPFFYGRPVQELLLRVQGTDAIVDELLDQIVSGFLDSLIALTALAALWVSYPGLSAIVVAAAALQGALTWLSLRATFDDFVRDVLAHARLYTFGAEALEGIADLKMVGVDRLLPEWSRHLDAHAEAGLRKKRRGAFWDGLVAAAQMVAPVLVLVAGAAMAIDGSVTVGAVVGFYSLATVCLAPISRLAGNAYRLRSTSEYIRRSYEILSARTESTAPAGASLPAGSLRGEIGLKGVEFRFSAEGDPVLSGIDLEIGAGQTLVVVGPTGSGKSTLAKLIATLYQPTAGTISIDGASVDLYDTAELRTRIGAVFQENVLLGGSVLENITMGREMPTSRVYRALAKACLLGEVKQMPLGFATPVGAGGLHLSGGQRQRLCLARAIAARPDVLVLDEATSGVDRITERRIYRNLMRLRCTKVFVTHRLYIAREADCVVVLDGGRVVESGRHGELMVRGGLYARMWEQQLTDRPSPEADESSGAA